MSELETSREHVFPPLTGIFIMAHTSDYELKSEKNHDVFFVVNGFTGTQQEFEDQVWEELSPLQKQVMERGDISVDFYAQDVGLCNCFPKGTVHRLSAEEWSIEDEWLSRPTDSD